MIRNYTGIVQWEMNEIAEKMHCDNNFFSFINIEETPKTIEARFEKQGFKREKDYLFRRQFSLAKDYINYYVIIVDEENIEAYTRRFCEGAERFFKNKSRFNKQNVAYLIFFNTAVTAEVLAFIKNLIINQDVMQGLPIRFDTILPIVYDTANKRFVVKSSKNKFSIKLLHIALRKFYRIIERTE